MDGSTAIQECGHNFNRLSKDMKSKKGGEEERKEHREEERECGEK